MAAATFFNFMKVIYFCISQKLREIGTLQMNHKFENTNAAPPVLEKIVFEEMPRNTMRLIANCTVA